MYYLGIDGGGTKTAFGLADDRGTVLRQIILGPSNPMDVGLPEALACVEKGIQEILGEIPPRDVCMFAGIAGGISGENRQNIRGFLSKFGFASVDNGSDAQNTVAAGLGKKDGIVVIMGTGSVTFVQRGGELIRLGGYGYLFEAGGSGYTVGRDAIVSALLDEEGSGESTCLRPMLLEQLKVSSLLSALSKLYEGGKSKIASYAPLVFEAYDKGDAVAGKILHSNAAVIAHSLQTARAKLPAEERPVRVVLSGGLLARQDLWIPMIREALAEANAYDIAVLERSPVMGALVLAGMPCKEENHDQNGNA